MPDEETETRRRVAAERMQLVAQLLAFTHLCESDMRPAVRSNRSGA